mmetsp:Transcript_43966/g.83970  ORF Transcript_43966/g.83970 Transcript_43966/m.83970 type:complete len:233 (-) Transcript_43966:867-1565(-)
MPLLAALVSFGSDNLSIAPGACAVMGDAAGFLDPALGAPGVLPGGSLWPTTSSAPGRAREECAYTDVVEVPARGSASPSSYSSKSESYMGSSSSSSAVRSLSLSRYSPKSSSARSSSARNSSCSASLSLRDFRLEESGCTAALGAAGGKPFLPPRPALSLFTLPAAPLAAAAWRAEGALSLSGAMPIRDPTVSKYFSMCGRTYSMFRISLMEGRIAGFLWRSLLTRSLRLLL